MVLQSKVFLLVLLQKYSPSLTKKNTLIRRVKASLTHSFTSLKKLGSDEEHSHGDAPSSPGIPKNLVVDLECGVLKSGGEMTQTEAMRLFTKIPFPVPRRVIHIRPRGLD
jgi:hypothetical protein